MKEFDFVKFVNTAQVSSAIFAIMVLLLIIAFVLVDKKTSSRSSKK